eukprot:SM000175S03287  [mRNA]  locus=s175:119452:120871:+ [translate_table: standard]
MGLPVPGVFGTPWREMSDGEAGGLAADVGAYSLLWGLLFLHLRHILLPARSFDFANRAVSLVHVAVALALASLSVADWADPLAGVGAPNTKEQMLAMVISLSYFIYDTVCCLCADPSDWSTTAHHALSILGFAQGIYSGRSGTELVACLWLMELSNPFMHAREMLKELGMKGTPIAELNDVLFASTFTFARLLVGPYVTYKSLKGQSTLGIKIGALGIQAISLFWFYKIARIAYWKLSKKAPKTKDKES